MPNYNEIGNNAALSMGGTEFPVTSMSYTEDADISDVQFNDGLNSRHVVTGVSYSGSFEHSGGNQDLRDILYEEVGGTTAPTRINTMIIYDDTHRYRFKEVLIDSRDKDFPADDRTEVTYDFVAEELIVETR